MNQNGRNLIAAALNARLPSVKVKFGTGNAPPNDTDNALSGDQITSTVATVTRDEATNSFVAPITFASAATLNEIGLFDGDDNMVDRFLLGAQSIVAGGKIQLEWELEVV